MVTPPSSTDSPPPPLVAAPSSQSSYINLHQRTTNSSADDSDTIHTDSGKRSRKRVRISEPDPISMTLNQEVVTLSEQECSESWWSATDFAAVKDSVKKECRDHRKSRRFSDCLTHAYRKACVLAAQEGNENEARRLRAVDDSTSTRSTAHTAATAEVGSDSEDNGQGHSISDQRKGSQEEQKQRPDYPKPAFGDIPDQGLVRWLEDEGPRGLEGYSSRLHAMRRQRHLQDTKHAVFLEQARQNISNERNEELLARQASMASRRARTFATLVGQADAWVVNAENSQELNIESGRRVSSEHDGAFENHTSFQTDDESRALTQQETSVPDTKVEEPLTEEDAKNG